MALSTSYLAAADQCDGARRRLRLPLAVAGELTGRSTTAPIDTLLHVQNALSEAQRDLVARIRMVLFGGEAVNGGLWALDVIERHFRTFDTGRDGEPSSADGIVSRADLYAVAGTGSGQLAAAAACHAEKVFTSSSMDLPAANGNDEL